MATAFSTEKSHNTRPQTAKEPQSSSSREHDSNKKNMLLKIVGAVGITAVLAGGGVWLKNAKEGNPRPVATAPASPPKSAEQALDTSKFVEGVHPYDGSKLRLPLAKYDTPKKNGEALFNLVAAYQVTGDRQFLNAAIGNNRIENNNGLAQDFEESAARRFFQNNLDQSGPDGFGQITIKYDLPDPTAINAIDPENLELFYPTPLSVYVAIGEWGEVPVAPESLLQTFTGEFQLNIGKDADSGIWYIDAYGHSESRIDRQG